MFKKIETGLIEEGKAQRVFLVPFARECRIFEHYEEVDDTIKELPVPLLLMQLRGDGKLGFAGGKVEKGESLITALKREADEEYALDIDETMLKKIKPLSTYATKNSNIHSFMIELDYETIKLFQQNASKSKHFLAEVQGYNLPPIVDYSNGKGIKEYLKNNFSGTAKQEILDLLKIEQLVSAELLQEILQELSLDKIELRADNGKYEGKTGELITLKHFLENVEKSNLLDDSSVVDVVYDKNLPNNIIGIVVHEQLIGQISFIPQKLNNCFMYQEEQ